MTNLFSDTKKFKQLDEDPTHTRLATLQSYLCKLLERGEITQEVYDEIRPQSAKIARAHGQPKVHKTFNRVPPFRPIIDTTGSTHYKVGQYLTNLLNPLTQNDYSLKDTFHAAERIKSIPEELLQNDDYVFVSLDVVSLFTNVPLTKTVNIVLDRIYKQKLIKTIYPHKTSFKKAYPRHMQKNRFQFQQQNIPTNRWRQYGCFTWTCSC